MYQKENYFLSQPHQPFFTLGVVNAIVMITIFALNYKGILTLEISSIFFHVYSIVFIVFLNLFTGFLFTTFTRFTTQPSIQKDIYINIFIVMLIGSIFFIIGAFLSKFITLLAMIIILFANYKIVFTLQNIFNKSTSQNLEDAFWILRGLQFGLAGNILMIISLFLPILENFAIAISFFMFIIFLTFAVGQRMIPFFSHSMEIKHPKFINIIFILLLIKTILFTLDTNLYIKIAEIILDIILGSYLLNEFLRLKLLHTNPQPILWILHLGLFWLPTAFLLDAISLSAELYLNTSFYFLGLHLLALGFLTTILIGFGTRVTYGHSGQPPQANGLVLWLFYFTQVVVFSRFLYSLNIGFYWGFDFIFDISFSAWLLLFVLWAIKFLPILIKKT